MTKFQKTRGAFMHRVHRFVSWLRYQAKMLRHRPRLAWTRAWIRRDEFHRSLDLDEAVMLDMNDADRKRYIVDLIRRRNEAHERDISS